MTGIILTSYDDNMELWDEIYSQIVKKVGEKLWRKNCMGRSKTCNEVYIYVDKTMENLCPILHNLEL